MKLRPDMCFTVRYLPGTMFGKIIRQAGLRPAHTSLGGLIMPQECWR